MDLQENDAIDNTGIPYHSSELRDTIDKDGTPQELTLKTAATLLACGIDPSKSTLFV